MVRNGIYLLDTNIVSEGAKIAFDLILVTRNVKDFENIATYFPLKIENWFD